MRRHAKRLVQAIAHGALSPGGAAVHFGIRDHDSGELRQVKGRAWVPDARLQVLEAQPGHEKSPILGDFENSSRYLVTKPTLRAEKRVAHAGAEDAMSKATRPPPPTIKLAQENRDDEQSLRE